MKNGMLCFQLNVNLINTTFLYLSRGTVRIHSTSRHRAADCRARLQGARLVGPSRAQQPLLRFFER